MQKKLYEITDEIKQIEDLFCNAVDENGDPRDLNEEENAFLKECFDISEIELKEKLDSYGKLITNLKLQSDMAKAEKDAFKAEMDRLIKRAKAAENRVNSLKSYILWAFQNLKIDKVKTALFTVSIKNNPMAITVGNVDFNNLEDSLITKEVSKSAIKDAIKDGKLIVSASGLILKSDGEIIDGLKAESTQSIMIK